MTHLRKMMLEELGRRNFAETTKRCYLQAVEEFASYFHCRGNKQPPEERPHDTGIQFLQVSSDRPPLQLADVVHEAKHHPLSVDLGSPTVREAFESGHVAAIGEHRLRDPQTLGVLVASLIRVDLALHLLGVGEELR